MGAPQGALSASPDRYLPAKLRLHLQQRRAPVGGGVCKQSEHPRAPGINMQARLCCTPLTRVPAPLVFGAQRAVGVGAAQVPAQGIDSAALRERSAATGSPGRDNRQRHFLKTSQPSSQAVVLEGQPQLRHVAWRSRGSAAAGAAAGRPSCRHGGLCLIHAAGRDAACTTALLQQGAGGLLQPRRGGGAQALLQGGLRVERCYPLAHIRLLGSVRQAGRLG